MVRTQQNFLPKWFNGLNTTDVLPKWFSRLNTTDVLPKWFNGLNTTYVLPKWFSGLNTTYLPKWFNGLNTTDVLPKWFSGLNTTDVLPIWYNGNKRRQTISSIYLTVRNQHTSFQDDMMAIPQYIFLRNDTMLRNQYFHSRRLAFKTIQW